MTTIAGPTQSEDDQAAAGTIELFDCNCGLGSPAAPVGGAFHSAPDLLASMDYFGIHEALVYSISALECDAASGNTRLLGSLKDQPRLRPAWVLLPEPDDPPAAIAVSSMLAAGVRAARLAPRLHALSMPEGVPDDLLGELARHRVPLFVDFGNRHWTDSFTNWSWVERTCRGFPDLPLVLVGQALGATRSLVPLLERCQNLHVEISCYQPCGGLDVLSARGLSGQILFGSGVPVCDASVPVSMLAYSRVSDDSRRAIASGNLARLLGDVQ